MAVNSEGGGDLSHFNSVFDLANDGAYQAWRALKLTCSARAGQAPIVKIKDLGKPTPAEISALQAQITNSNFAIYQTGHSPGDESKTAERLRAFTAALGLKIAEAHRSAGENGVVALKVSHKEHQRGFIPYSRKAMNWHTDGYYNAPQDTVRAFVLHCVRPAETGGQSQIIDNDIAYIRLRDKNPDAVARLSDPQAMTIPETREPNGALRPASVGPVFFVEGGALGMRYTARTRSIAWKDDATKAAAHLLQSLLEAEQAYLSSITLAPGQGILNNNTLHNRAAFDPQFNTRESRRLLYRIRFRNKLTGGSIGQTQ